MVELQKFVKKSSPGSSSLLFLLELQNNMHTPNQRISVMAGHLGAPEKGAQTFEMEAAAPSLHSMLHAFSTLKSCHL